MKKPLFPLYMLAVAAVVSVGVSAETAGFDPELWELQGASVVEYMGRESLVGFAYLKDVEFVNGVIDVDVAVDGRRSYPGINFRIQSAEDYERYYMRPHRTCGQYPDVHQYTPVINGIAGWQLYNGSGFTSFGEVPKGEWVHLRIEVKGTQARVFLADMENPVLEIDELTHGVSSGTIGLNGPRNGTAYFSDFRWKADEGLEFEPPTPTYPPPGVIDHWKVAGPYKLKEIDLEKHPGEQEIGEPVWIDTECATSGLVDIAKYFGRSGREPDVALAKVNISAEKNKTMEFKFGYSDAAAVFLNGQLLFAANSSYQSRDKSFLGIIGYFDALYLPLRKGDNELLMMVAEGFGGWGFMGQDGKAVYTGKGVEKEWEADGDFKIPETVLYDSQRDMIYVTNFDRFAFAPGAGGQSISRLSPEGKVVDPEWVKGLSNPTGMAMKGSTLLAIERKALVEIDVSSGEVTARHPLLTAGFLNDIAVAGETVYVSDSRSGIVYSFSDGAFEAFIPAGKVSQPNGLHAAAGTLYIGSNGDGTVKAVDITDGTISTFAKLGPGIIDGIESDGSGGILVSHWEGRMYRVDSAGEVTRILDTTSPGTNIANFGYDSKRKRVIIPTFSSNSVVSYSLPY